jgi:hypothetical protein
MKHSDHSPVGDGDAVYTALFASLLDMSVSDILEDVLYLNFQADLQIYNALTIVLRLLEFQK